MADKELFYVSAATHFKVFSCIQNLQCKQNYTGEQVSATLQSWPTIYLSMWVQHQIKLCTPHPQNLHLRKV